MGQLSKVPSYGGDCTGRDGGSIMRPSSKNTAVVTGASSGIGAVYADRLAKRGYNLILVARNGTKLSTLAHRLKGELDVSVQTIAADLSDKNDLGRAEAMLRSNASINLLLNNAGTGATAPLLNSDVEQMDKMIRLNVLALTRLTYAAVPGFVARGGGTIINISSIVAISPETFNGVYGGTKAFVLAFSQSLHHELVAKGVRIQAVLPGATATGFWDLAGLPVHKLPTAIVMSAEDTVDAALAGLDQGEFVTIPSLVNRAEWEQFEATRRSMSGKLSRAVPAPRYNVNKGFRQ